MSASLLSTIRGDQNLEQLSALLKSRDVQSARAELLTEFTRLAEYSNAQEWNQAVRVCEALAILGWGDREPVEARRGQFFNGNPETCFFNRFDELRFVDAIWSKRKTGLAMEPERTSYHASPDAPGKPTVLWTYPTAEDIQDIALATQRNWIEKNPIRIGLSIGNCYPGSKPLVQDMEAGLCQLLNTEMRPELYGSGLQTLHVHCSFSYFDNPSCKTNHVLFEEPKALSKAELEKRLTAMFSAQEIREQGYYARNKFEFGNFQRETGKMRVEVRFSREFSQLPLTEQRNVFCSDLHKAVSHAVERLTKKKLSYDLKLMLADFAKLLWQWRDRG